MDKVKLEDQIVKAQNALEGKKPGTDEYDKLVDSIKELQALQLKEREFDLKEKTETSKCQSEWRKVEISDKEQENKVVELRNKDRNDKRQVALAYAKIIVGSIGTVGSILLVTACEEDKIIRSKAYQFVKNFAQRFI